MKQGFKYLLLFATLTTALVASCMAQNGELNPADAITASDALLYKADYKGARAELEAAIKGNVEYYPLTLRYAYLSYLLKDYAAAAEFYAKAAQLGPREEAPLTGLMNTALAQQDAKWKGYAALLLTMNPDQYSALYAFAYNDFAAKRYQQAADRFEKMVSLNNYDVDAKLMLGWSKFYLGDYTKARSLFEYVLGLYPDNASAKEGLSYLPKTYTFGTGLCFAGLAYSGNPYKKDGYYLSMPVTMGYKDKLALSLSYAYTYLNWVSPVADSKQADRNVLLAYQLKLGLTARAAYDHISMPDSNTRLGEVWSGGADYSRTLAEDYYLVAGGWVSGSNYTTADVTQVSPHAGIGLSGHWYADLFLHKINSRYTDADYVRQTAKTNAVGMAVAVGPYWGGLMFNAQAYTGEKRFMVDGWGTVIANAPDLYRGGWKIGASYFCKAASYFVLYGSDKVRAFYGTGVGLNNGTVNYTAAVIVAGANIKF